MYSPYQHKLQEPEVSISVQMCTYSCILDQPDDVLSGWNTSFN